MYIFAIKIENDVSKTQNIFVTSPEARRSFTFLRPDILYSV